jgi:orotate phosphoribosyltransferase
MSEKDTNMVIEELRQSEALLEGHFLLSSGRHSDRYCQCAKLLQYPDRAERVIAIITEQVKDLDIDMVVGPAMGGIIVAYELGRQLGVPAIFTERVDNVMCLRRGFEVKPGMKLLISEDVVTTGKSSLETIEVLKAFGAEIENISDSISQLAVQGPLALKAMQKLTAANVIDMEYYTNQIITFAGIDNILFSTTGYTGSGGCEIYFRNEDAMKIWDAVFEAGKEYDIKPIGLGARDTLRLEMGFCLYGHEIDDTISPIEAGLGWITKFVDGKDFIDRKFMEDLKANGVTRRIAGFELIDRGIPRNGYEVCDAEGNVIGEVRSGTFGPSVNKGIGTALIKKEFAKSGTEIFIKVRNRLLKAVTVKMPFYKPE